MTTILKARELIKIFTGDEKILKGISLEIEKGTFTALLGPSGSGKTTLLHVLSGLLKPTHGTVEWEGVKLSQLSENRLAKWKRDKAGYIFQDYLLLNHLTVRENIEIGISPDTAPLSSEDLIQILELEAVLHKFPSQLSGGQKQRTAIGRAVIKKPDILFCDEATGALDEANSKKVVELLHYLKAGYGVTVLFVTHNRQIAKTADRVIMIKDGLIHGDRYNKAPIPAKDMVWE